MVRALVDRAFDDTRNYKEIACLSTDTKPTEGVVSGSIALEVDTGAVSFFEETSGEWIPQFTMQEG